MKVSIVTVCFDSDETIEDTIRSVLGQGHKDIEYIIVDGGSTDGTLEIIGRYEDRISTVISEPDRGIYDAMNKGLRSATGDILATLNSDDVYAEKTTVGQVEEFIRNNALDAAYGDLIYVDRHDVGRVRRFWQPGRYKKGAFCHGWVLPHPTFFCRKEIFEKFGYFNDKLQIAADFELMLRFIEKHRIKTGYLPKVIARMGTGGKANVLRGMIQGNREIIRSFRLNGLRLSPWFFIRKPMTKMSQLFRRPSETE
ncbi:MAG: glycosyltransferase family 2 protein [Planctomycetota bacterium]|jgi:glycosyltransferase involved in cell wall biosynthesis